MTANRGQKKTRARSRQSDANVRVPEDTTTEFIKFIDNLQIDGPKTRYLKEVIYSKFVSDDTDSPDVRRTRAINKWLSVERENEATNDRLLNLEEEYNILPRVTWQTFRARAQRYVSKVLRDTVPLEALFGGFSGGASTTKSRTESHPALKYLGKAEITPAARWWFDLISIESPLWLAFQDQLEIADFPGNVLFTVPKSTIIDRCAAKEPDLNMYMQKGVGNYIRRRLRYFGINLNDQSINQDLAREGSITGRLATLDLSSASDSLSIELVSALVPPLWFGLLSDLRSPKTLIDGEWHENHMFSSMGNGFTFELESLLFWAIACAVRDLSGYSGVVSVYGDDIIVESGLFNSLSWVLGVLGFSVNSDKSFYMGPFRESCGGHYHDGHDITPFYLRRPLKTIRDVMIIANQIRRWSELPGTGILDPTLEPLWLFLRDLVPRALWGGTDLNSDRQVVSWHLPSKEMTPVTRSRNNSTGGYLLWLDTCGDSTLNREPMIGSERSTTCGTYRLRRVNRQDIRKPPCYFYHEVHMAAE